ncbi:EAL domain-containing protein [Neobacillus niacini]|uniref:sensor domain-containing protein n=1 Tax=Neobacillus niacini TaxID=86668 RepID=UPI002856C814|nr:EAL domain-containing protein [Neobacillus niacini]MDR6999808.1 diguanylate cyclase (GGDEF)-like protein/PAS domain S-box-containing protein [Neobacillus niacini]
METLHQHKNPLNTLNDNYQDIIALNKELSELKYALDESSIIAITDQRGIIQAANKKFCELSKYTREELIGQDHRMINSGYHPKEFFRKMWKTIGSGEVWKGEIQNRTKDGKLYWVHTTIVPILNEKGKPYRYISFRVDITEQKQMEAELQKSLKDDFNQTVNILENGIFKMKKDADGNIVYTLAEGKLLQKMGFNTQSHQNKSPYEVFSKEIADFKLSQYHLAFTGQGVQYEIELFGILVYVDVTPIKQGGQVVELIGTVYDITELRNTQKQLQENRMLYQSLFQHSQDAVFTFDTKGRILTMNPATERVLGYTLENFKKKSGTELIVKEYQSIHLSCFEKVLKGEPQNFEMAVYHQKGHQIFLNVTYLPIIMDQKITGIYTIGKDITEQKKIQELNAFLATHDELTELLNRRGLEENLKKAITHSQQSNQKLAVMYIDLDRFKNVNDTLGHMIGDRLLEQISRRLNTQIGDGNYIARMGGDEFMVLCPVIEVDEDAAHVAKEILACLKDPFFIEEYELYMTASIGISIYPTAGDNVVDLMKHADIALYKAKDQGRNNFQIYSSVMDKMSYQSFFLERDLRKALLNHEFIVHLQPRVDSKTRQITSAEALIRWNHPTLGLIPPSNFIPLAEETGLIIPMGKWIKKRVCELLVQWREEGIPLIPISINISAQRFLQKDFAKSVKETLEEYGVEGKFLEIEITENSLMRNEVDVEQMIQDLKELGIKIYIDDFGTGYSSFSYLKSFKIDGIKIDRSFIHNISSQSENAGITSAMIHLAQILIMDVIAEGVETEEELQFLHDHHCNQVQGYLFSKPLPKGEFERLLVDGI